MSGEVLPLEVSLALADARRTQRRLLELTEALRPFAEEPYHTPLRDVDDLTEVAFIVCRECDEGWPCRFERARIAL